MTVCAVWLARDFLHRTGRPIDIPPCDHPPEDCPPIQEEPPVNLPDGHEWCTTNSHTKRHISGNLRTNPHTPRLMGRHGRTLCGCGADDERRANYWNDLYGNGKTVKVADLQPCQSCTSRAAAKLKATAGAR